jgi:hypothetical protein
MKKIIIYLAWLICIVAGFMQLDAQDIQYVINPNSVSVSTDPGVVIEYSWNEGHTPEDVWNSLMGNGVIPIPVKDSIAGCAGIPATVENDSLFQGGVPSVFFLDNSKYEEIGYIPRMNILWLRIQGCTDPSCWKAVTVWDSDIGQQFGQSVEIFSLQLKYKDAFSPSGRYVPGPFPLEIDSSLIGTPSFEISVNLSEALSYFETDSSIVVYDATAQYTGGSSNFFSLEIDTLSMELTSQATFSDPYQAIAISGYEIVADTMLIIYGPMVMMVMMVMPDISQFIDGMPNYMLRKKFLSAYPEYEEQLRPQIEMEGYLTVQGSEGQIIHQGSVGVSVGGNFSAHGPDKSLVLKFPDNGKFENDIFSKGMDSYDELFLRKGSRFENPGIDWCIHRIMADAGLAAQSGKPVILFLNGRYWGFKILRERVEKDFLKNQFGGNKSDMTIGIYNEWTNSIELKGVHRDSTALIAQFEEWRDDLLISDPSSPNFVAKAKSLYDTKSFFRYIIGLGFFDQVDFGGSNTRLLNVGGRWKHIWKDFDNGASVSPFQNTFQEMHDNSNPQGYGSVRFPILNKAIENQDLEYEYMRVYADMELTTFRPDSMHAHLDAVEDQIGPLMANNSTRWDEMGFGVNPDLATWLNIHQNQTRFFFENRADFITGDMIARYGRDTSRVHLSIVEDSTCVEDENAMLISDLVITESIPVDRLIFDGLPENIRFVGEFQFATLGNGITIDTIIQEDFWKEFSSDSIYYLKTHFGCYIPDDVAPIVINEVATSVSTDSLSDFVELYNPTNLDIDMKGYNFSDKLNNLEKHPVQESLVVPAEGYRIIWCDGNGASGPDHTDFSLKNSGENFVISDDAGNIIKSFSWNSAIPQDESYNVCEDEIDVVIATITPMEDNQCLNPTLPVELMSFTGSVLEKGNGLNWVTANEEDVSHFQIERSGNGIGFENIGKIEAVEAVEYFFWHEYPQGLEYYRLKTVDLDGSFEYSNIIVLKRVDERHLKLSPNPSGGKLVLSFSSEKEQSAMIAIIGIAGRVLYLDREEVQVGENSIQLRLGLIPGIYFLELEIDGKILIERLVISK